MAEKSKIIDLVEKYLTQYGEALTENIKKNIKDKGKIASGKLYNSIRFKVKTDNTKVTLDILAEDYLDYVDKGRRAGKQPPIAPILKWVKIRRIRGYPNKKGKYPKSEQVAFAVARNIGKKGYPASNVKTDAINKVNTQLNKDLRKVALQGVTEEIAVNFVQEIAKEIKNKNIQITTTKTNG